MSKLRGLGGGLLALLLLGVGFAAGAAADRAALLPGAAVREPAGLDATLSPFWQAWEVVQANYVERASLDSSQLVHGAIAGLIDALGDTGHSRFLSPQDLQAEQAALSGRLEGVGAEIGLREGRPTIIAPIAGSPAQRAGLKPGDVLVRVNGQDVSGLSLAEITNRVRGPAGSTVTLTILRGDSSNLLDVTIPRARLSVPNVTWARAPGTSVADILIDQFGEGTTDQLRTAIGDARAQGATAVVLDLRNDPGGLRDEAVGAASQFLRDGNVLLEQDARGHRTAFPVRPDGAAPDLPMVVLVNNGTASAAEIVAGALQDHQRGKLIGETTFGTGTVLQTFGLNDGSAILLGVAEWFTPNGRQIWHRGIAPDVQVALPSGAYPLLPAELQSMSAEQLRGHPDAQLLRALAELGGTAR
jgi:carboxyl-terminal processing protease